MFLPHLASRLYGTPLLLARSKLDIILSVLGNRIGWLPSASDSASDSDNPPPIARFTRSDPNSLLNQSPDLSLAASGIAVIGITGSLIRRNIGVDAQSGLMSYAEIAQNLELAAADPSICGILLDIDSPGGEAGGVFELAQRIREIDAIKPVWALACDSAFSAAYAIACAASRVLVTQTSGLGSIGVIAMHVDQSVRDAQQGYRFTAVTAGDFKGDLSPHEPLNPGSSSRLQAEVDRLYGLFVDHVASMRAMSQKAVRATQAACFFGPESIDVGLADVLVRADQVVAEFAAFLASRSMHRLLSTDAQVPFALARASPIAALSASVPPDQPDQPVSYPIPPIFDANLKEISMTQDLQPNNAPQTAPLTEDLPEPAALPVTDKPVGEAGHRPAEPSPKPDEPGSATNAHAQALEIAELCQLAGQTTHIASFLAQGISAAQVRQALLVSRAQSEEISSLIHPDAAKPVAKATSDGASALLAAVKKLTSTP